MNKYLLLSSIIFLSLTKSAAADCTACKANELLAKEIAALKYDDTEDHFTGTEKAQKAVENIEAFNKTPAKDPNRTSQFKSLLQLAQVAMPYDGEGELASSVANLLKNKQLKKEYDTWMAAAPKTDKTASCQAELMEKNISQQLCLQKAGVKGHDTKGKAFPNSCLKPFNYETCRSTK